MQIMSTATKQKDISGENTMDDHSQPQENDFKPHHSFVPGQHEDEIRSSSALDYPRIPSQPLGASPPSQFNPTSTDNPGIKTSASGVDTLGGAETAEGSGSRGRWVDRVLLRLGLRSTNQIKETASQNGSHKRGFRKRFSDRWKRGLFRREKKNKGKKAQNGLHAAHDGTEASEENITTTEPSMSAAKNRLSVVPEHPQLAKASSNVKSYTPQYLEVSEPESNLDLDPSSTRQEGPLPKPILADRDQPRIALHDGAVDNQPPRKEHHRQSWKQEQASQSISDLYAASFKPKPALNTKAFHESFQIASSSASGPRLDNLGLGLNTGTDQRFNNITTQQRLPRQQATAGWLASLPSASDIHPSQQDTLLSSGIVKEASGLELFRQQLQQQPSFTINNSGGYVRGSPSTQHLASSRHPIADAHAEEWRRRTVGGFPIPERYSSRWRPRSRCPSSRRCGSIDSRQTTYNPYDLPRIPRQPLFNDIVDLLSLSKAVNNNLHPGNGPNDHMANQNKPSPLGGGRLDSISSTISTSNKGAGGSGDWSSYNGRGSHGEMTNSTTMDRSGSGSGSRLAQQISASGDGSTITNTTAKTTPPLFQIQLPHTEGHSGLLGLGLPESFMEVDEELEPQDQWRVNSDKGKAKATTPGPPANQTAGKNTLAGPAGFKPLHAPTTGASPSDKSGRSSGSEDAAVPEAWWTNQEQLQDQGHLAYSFGLGSGRPSTPSSPLARRREKWNVRRRREREGR